MHLRWSQSVPSPLRGLSLARERETLLAWDGEQGLFLFDQAGTLQAQRPSPVPIAAAGCADDGNAYAVASRGTPMVCCLAPDLSPRWQRPLPQRATALAMEPLGRRLAVADAAGTLHVLDEGGRTLWQATTPRPLHHLAFVPEKPILVGTADFGLVLCFGASGECLWRDGLVAHVGALAVNGDGSSVLLACFSDGLYRYRITEPEQQCIPLESICSRVAASYDGDCLLTADHENRLYLRDRMGILRDQTQTEAPVVAIALGALGDYAVAGLADGTLLWFDDRRF